MKGKTKYTHEDRQGVATLVTSIVGHSVSCAIANGGLAGCQEGLLVFMIQPLSGYQLKEFWLESDYSKTQQFWASPIDAGIHYAKHYLEFVKSTEAATPA